MKPRLSEAFFAESSEDLSAGGDIKPVIYESKRRYNWPRLLPLDWLIVAGVSILILASLPHVWKPLGYLIRRMP